ncbi:MAG: tRNA epoxyqueuosine(34) reductase QueG [Blastopirellula sp.]|nr:MAG: tRNA epoxyqueuosine(34) reductase QueG [Blastopirellula sp.]
MPESELTLSDQIKQEALALGFMHCGICPAVTAPNYQHFQEWLAAGYAGQMSYLEDRVAAYQDPGHVLDGAKSILMLSLNYRTIEPVTPQAGQGRLSRYAWGEVDYHDLIHKKLKQLKRKFIEIHPAVTVRGVVDTAPLLEREYAQMAGLGWVGKNTLLLNQQRGSLFFLAALLTDVELDYDTPQQTDHCGTCTACLDSCPTDAFVKPYVLDATKCISYLTIELREPIPVELRRGMGDWMFGCDVCQDVCPWNRKSPESELIEFQPIPAHDPIDLISLFDLDDEQFRTRFRKTPLWRSKRRGILRNAAIVLGNNPAPRAIAALTKGLNDIEPLIRGASAWALGSYSQKEAVPLLSDRLEREEDQQVISEIRQALSTFQDLS